MFRDDARPHKRPRFELTPLSDDAPETSDAEEQRPLPNHTHKQKHTAGTASSSTSARTSTDAALDDASAPEDALEPTLEQLEQEQSRNQSRFRHRMEDIFTRYAQDFNETADEIDIRTGHVVVDRGHWRSLPDVYVAEQDGFEEESSDFSSDEDGILDDHDADILDFLARPAETPAWLNGRDSPAPGKSAHTHLGRSDSISSSSLFQPRAHPVAPMARALQVPPDDVVLQQFGTAGPAVLDLLKRQAEAERRASSESPAPAQAASEAAGSDRGQTLRQEMDEAGEDDLSVLLDSPAHQLHARPLVKGIDKVSLAMWPAGRLPKSGTVIEVVPDSDEDEADTTHPANDAGMGTSSRRPFGSPERPKVQANPAIGTADANAIPSEADKRKALYRATLEAAWAKLDTRRSDQAPTLVSPASVQQFQTTVSSPLQPTTPFKTPVRSSHAQPSQAHQMQSHPTNTDKDRSAASQTRPVRSQSLTAPSETLRKQAMLQHHQWQQQQKSREHMAGPRPRTDLTRELRALTAGYQDEAQTRRNARLTANRARESAAAAAAAPATPTKTSLTPSSKTTPSGSVSPASAWVPKEMRALFAGPRISAANDAATRAAKGYTAISGPVYRAEKRQEEATKQHSRSTSRLRSNAHRRSSESTSPRQKRSVGQTPAKEVAVRAEMHRSASPTESDAARLLRPRRRLIKYSDKFHARPQYGTPTESETRKQTPASAAPVSDSATDVPRTPLFINLADEDDEDDLAGASPALSTEQVSARAQAAAARHARLYPPVSKSAAAAAKTEPIDYNPFDLMDEEDEISGLATTPAPVVRQQQQQQQQPTWILPPDTADGAEQEAQEAMLERVTDSEEGHSLLSSSQSSGPLPAEPRATPVHRRSATRPPRQNGTTSVSKMRCRPFKAQPTPPQTFLSPQQASAIGARLSAIAATQQRPMPDVRDCGFSEEQAMQDRSFMQAPLFRASSMKPLPSVAGALAQPNAMSQDTAALIQARLKDLVDEAAGHGTDTVTRTTATDTEQRGRLVDAFIPRDVQAQAVQMSRRESDSENDRMAEEQLRGDVRAGFLPAEQMVIATLDLD